MRTTLNAWILMAGRVPIAAVFIRDWWQTVAFA